MATPMSLFEVCPLCHRWFYRETALKIGDRLPIALSVEGAFLEGECPLNEKSATKKHTGIEFVGKKLPRMSATR